jgi:hypothetical protein
MTKPLTSTLMGIALITATAILSANSSAQQINNRTRDPVPTEINGNDGTVWSDQDYVRYIDELDKKVEKVRQSCQPSEIEGLILSVVKLETEQSEFFDSNYSSYYYLFESVVPLYSSCRTALRRIVDNKLAKDRDTHENFKANLCSSLRMDFEGQDDYPGQPRWRDPWCGMTD